jgi:hypothetical protein
MTGLCTFTDRDVALRFAESVGKDEVLHIGDNCYIVPMRPVAFSKLNAKGDQQALEVWNGTRLYFGGVPRSAMKESK